MSSAHRNTPEQFVLPGLEPVAVSATVPAGSRPPSRPKPPEEPATDRFFLALLPPPELAVQIADLATTLRAQYGLGGKVQAPDRMHVTLAHLGDYLGVPDGLLERAHALGAAVRAAPFQITFNRAASFRGRPGHHPFVLLGDFGNGSGVLALQHMIAAAMPAAGFGRWVDKRFTPHLTLLYGNPLAGAHSIDPVGWAAGDFVLIHSLLRRTIHHHLARWPLRG